MAGEGDFSRELGFDKMALKVCRTGLVELVEELVCSIMRKGREKCRGRSVRVG